MQASKGGSLQLQSGTVTNTGGTVEALAGSRVNLSTSIVIIRGTLATVGTGEMHVIGTTTLNGVTITGTSLDIDNGQTVVVARTIKNTGAIRLNSSGATTTLRISGDVTLTGGGAVAMSNQVNNLIFGGAVTDRLINQDHTIRGAGQIGVNLMFLTNRGTVIADQTNTLTIDPRAGADEVINPGTIRGTSGAPLTLAAGSYTNFEGLDPGLIEANGSIVSLSSATISGGDVDVVGLGEIRLTSSTITGGTLDNSAAGIIRPVGGLSTLGGVVNNPLGGRIILDNALDLALQAGGTYNNAGDIEMNSSGGLTDLIMSGGVVTPGGGGTVTMSNHVNNRILGAAAGNVLVNVNSTISGAGQIGVNQMFLDNRATIIANQPNSLTIDPTNGAGGVVNSGILRASDGGTMRVQFGTFANTGGIIESLGA